LSAAVGRWHSCIPRSPWSPGLVRCRPIADAWYGNDVGSVTVWLQNPARRGLSLKHIESQPFQIFAASLRLALHVSYHINVNQAGDLLSRSSCGSGHFKLTHATGPKQVMMSATPLYGCSTALMSTSPILSCIPKPSHWNPILRYFSSNSRSEKCIAIAPRDYNVLPNICTANDGCDLAHQPGQTRDRIRRSVRMVRRRGVGIAETRRWSPNVTCLSPRT
jgi:hypothetical protein